MGYGFESFRMVATRTAYAPNRLVVITNVALEDLQPVKIFLEPFVHHMVI